MADLKISQLTVEATELNDSDILPLVQGGVNKKLPISVLAGALVNGVIPAIQELFAAVDKAILTALYSTGSGTITVGPTSGSGASFDSFDQYGQIVFIIASGTLTENKHINIEGPPPPKGDGNTVPPQITFAFHFGATPHDISAGTHCNFNTFTGVANKKSILTLIWDGGEYVQQSFSQL